MISPPSRRQALGLGASSLALAVSGCAAIRPRKPEAALFRYSRDLPIPPTLQPTRIDAAGAHYEIEQREVALDILPGLKTKAWTYGGAFPGPTIRARRGTPVIVRHVNKLSTPTVVHLHGGRTPPASDGFPTDAIFPSSFAGPAFAMCGPGIDLSTVQATIGDTRAYVYPNDQPAATLWYHDHCMGGSGRNTYMGLAGFYILDDEEEAALPLPRGDQDVPLMICTRRFAVDGAFVYDHHGYTGAGGPVMLVNGAPWPRLKVQRRKYRLRLLNADNASPLDLALEDGRPMIQIASDGGLLERPVSLTHLPLAMAERAEVVVDFADCADGQTLLLLNRRGQGGMAEIMRFEVVGGAVEDSARIPDRLAVLERLRPEDAVRLRDFTFGAKPIAKLQFPPIAWTINGRRFDPERVDATPKLGEVEIWRFTYEKTPFPKHCHPPHVHLTHFQVLERNGKPPPPHEGGWKDTVSLEGDETVSVVVRFDGYRGRYLLHCHNLEHEDHDMMARFDVV
jgi:spore coat protein A